MIATAGCVLLAAGAASGADDPAATADDYRFGVYYKDRRIGEHRWHIVQSHDATRVRSDAKFEVKLLFVRVYHYQHHAEEAWQHGCLTALSSTTDDNGEAFAVRAALPGGAPAPADSGVRQVELGSACPASFAYWDLDRLRRSPLVNAQTGDVLPATLTREAETMRDGKAAVRYRLQAEGMTPITLWYGQYDGRWLALETQRDDGNLVYRLEESRNAPAPASELSADRAGT